jgi:hypothetical protein
MGQYYIICNLDKKEYLLPHKFGDGLKLMEFGASADGTMLGLAVLLADGNGRGGGDLHADNPIIGSWAGDRIVIAGDYADPKYTPSPKNLPKEDFVEGRTEDPEDAEIHYNLYNYADAYYEDISDKVIDAIIAGEGDYTPLSTMDRSKGGWRDKKYPKAEETYMRPDMVITTKQ